MRRKQHQCDKCTVPPFTSEQGLRMHKIRKHEGRNWNSNHARKATRQVAEPPFTVKTRRMELVPMVPESAKPTMKTTLDACPVCDLSLQKLATVVPMNEVQCCPRCTLALRPILDHVEAHFKSKNISITTHAPSRGLQPLEK